MYEANINMLKKSLQDGNPPYGILSLTADTLEAMRSQMAYNEMIADDKELLFRQAMEKIISGLEDLEYVMPGDSNAYT